MVHVPVSLHQEDLRLPFNFAAGHPNYRSPAKLSQNLSGSGWARVTGQPGKEEATAFKPGCATTPTSAEKAARILLEWSKQHNHADALPNKGTVGCGAPWHAHAGSSSSSSSSGSMFSLIRFRGKVPKNIMVQPHLSRKGSCLAGDRERRSGSSADRPHQSLLPNGPFEFQHSKPQT